MKYFLEISFSIQNISKTLTWIHSKWRAKPRCQVSYLRVITESNSEMKPQNWKGILHNALSVPLYVVSFRGSLATEYISFIFYSKHQLRYWLDTHCIQQNSYLVGVESYKEVRDTYCCWLYSLFYKAGPTTENTSPVVVRRIFTCKGQLE